VDISQQLFDGIPIIRIAGDLERLGAPALDKVFRVHVGAGNHRMILDLSECGYVDSGGLATIMTAVTELRDDGLLAIVAPNPGVRRLLEIVGLFGHPLCAIVGSLFDALALCGQALPGTAS
jgi:anti-anti-sigma factor